MTDQVANHLLAVIHALSHEIEKNTRDIKDLHDEIRNRIPARHQWIPTDLEYFDDDWD